MGNELSLDDMLQNASESYDYTKLFLLDVYNYLDHNFEVLWVTFTITLPLIKRKEGSNIFYPIRPTKHRKDILMEETYTKKIKTEEDVYEVIKDDTSEDTDTSEERDSEKVSLTKWEEVGHIQPPEKELDIEEVSKRKVSKDRPIHKKKSPTQVDRQMGSVKRAHQKELSTPIKSTKKTNTPLKDIKLNTKIQSKKKEYNKGGKIIYTKDKDIYIIGGNTFEVKELIKTIEGWRYIETERLWTVPATEINRKKLEIIRSKQ